MFCPTCLITFPPHLTVCPKDATPLIRMADPKDPLVGTSIEGRFTLRERIGGGGMGVVYAAIQHSLGREVALKLIRPDRETIDTSKRFLREARLLSRLTHPNIVAVLDTGQTQDGLLFIAMELLKGRSLSALIKEGGPLPVDRTVEIGGQIAGAIEAAHRASIVHRDLKLGNVMLLDGSGDRIKVLDFGLARSTAGDLPTMTEAGRIMGTPKAIAPETALGQRATPASDVYALGVILYEMLAGVPPFDAEHVRGLLYKHIHENPPPLDQTIPLPLRELISEMLQKQPEKRPSAEQVRQRLKENPQIPVVVESAPQKRSVARALAFVSVMLLALAAGMTIERFLREEPPLYTSSGETRPGPPSIAAVPARVEEKTVPEKAPAIELKPEPETRRPAGPPKIKTPEPPAPEPKTEPKKPEPKKSEHDRRPEEPLKVWIDRLISSAKKSRDRFDAGPQRERATQLLLDLSRLAASPRLEAEIGKVDKLAAALSALENEAAQN